MLLTLTITFVTLIVVWWMFSSLVAKEVERGNRLVLAHTRERLDVGVEWLVERGAAVVRYVDRHIIRLSWYYSLHSLLQAALKVVVSVYDYLEQWFHENRQRARALRAERRRERQLQSRGMLHSIAEHRQSVALSEAEKRKLKTKKLERE